MLNLFHRSVLRVSGGRLGHRAFGMDIVELRTVGRRTGETRSTMLTVPVLEVDRLVLVASKGGDDRDPQWYRNLLVSPDAEIVRDGEVRRVRAATATPEEARLLWPLVIAAYRPYASYRTRARREIPLVICTYV